ncbi:MAG: hypothetical protein QOD09_465 [Bradyrhizobium sp.]|jgi:hypothetical protein|nr:hypothetical protein [Bradyrhizobium sp.]MEA2951637.1 hypothetical protein [Alphaproteobacteria bacterium]
MNALSCPGRGAAFFMPLRRTGTPVRYSKLRPGSAAHHGARAARCAASGARRLVRLHRALAFLLIATLAGPALAQDQPKPLKTVRIRERAPGADILYTVDEDGTVRIDWPAVETLASSKADRTVLPLAQLMLAIRDGTWKPAR